MVIAEVQEVGDDRKNSVVSLAAMLGGGSR